MEEKDLIKKAQSGDVDSTDKLMKKYKPLVLTICRKYFIINVEQDDLIQEGMIGLFNALSSYNIDGESSFKTYASTCIKNKIQSAFKKNNRQKNTPLNTYFSINNQGKILLSSPQDEKDIDEDFGFFLESNDLSPEESIIFREKLAEIVKKTNKLLSSYERKVLRYFVSGLNYLEIAKILGKEPKSIDNALSRIKIKLRDLKGGI